jgi:hypothetical protein
VIEASIISSTCDFPEEYGILLQMPKRDNHGAVKRRPLNIKLPLASFPRELNTLTWSNR